AAPLIAASSAGTAALTPPWAALRSSPSAAAIRPIMSGVRNCITYETRLVAVLVAMGSLLLLWTSVRFQVSADPQFPHLHPKGKAGRFVRAPPCGGGLSNRAI